MYCFKILIILWQENVKNLSLKRRVLGRYKSCMNSFLNAATGYVFLSIATKIICSQIYFTSVLLYFNHKIAYWSLFPKEICNLIRPISVNVVFFAFFTIYVNSLILIKLVQAILKVMFILRFVIKRNLSSMIFSKMFFIIKRYFYFLLENSFLLPLMMSAIYGLSKPFKLKHLSIW